MDNQHTTSAAAATRRRHPRVECDLELSYRLDDRPDLRLGRIMNLGEGGARVDLPEPLQLPARISLIFPDPAAQDSPAEALEIQGRVVWTVADREGGPWPSGIQFQKLDPAARSRLQQLLATLLP